jgi:hypothetical protein
MLSDEITKAADAEHLSRHIYWEFDVVRPIPCIVSDLHTPDLFHTIQIGMLEHLKKWIFHFMKIQERLDK